MAYKSKFEKSFAKSLKESGIKFEYEPMVVAYTQPEKKRKYTPDFKIRTKAGVFIIETKGRLTREDRKKMILVKEQHPDMQVVLVFQNASVTLDKRSKTTYAMWAADNGFEWVDFRKGIPDKWKS